MIAVTYSVFLEEPLLATSIDGDPNSAVSYDYIPGSLIRGAVAGYLATQEDDIARTQRDLIFSGAVRFLNAYPTIVLGDQRLRSLPVPASWKVAKLKADQDDIKARDFGLLSREQRSATGATKDLSGFTLGADIQPGRYHPSRQIAVHTLRDRKAGRSTQALGTIYRYDALASGEEFQGVVLTQTIMQAEKIKQILSNAVTCLGGAQGGGYGKVKISAVQTYEDWKEVSVPLFSISAQTNFRLTLLSDTIVKDNFGQSTTDISTALPFPAKLIESYSKTGYVGGFNRKWGLPLPQDQVLKAGSVIVLQALSDISVDQLQNLIEYGIGQRRVEGFGRIAVNWGEKEEFSSHELQRDYSKSSSDGGSDDKNVTLHPESARMAQRMEERLWRYQLDRALVQSVQKLKPVGLIPNSQLSRLRIIARSALSEARAAEAGKKSLDRLVRLFTDEKNGLRPTALKKYNKVRVDGKRLPDWIVDLAQKPQSVWQILTPLPPKLLPPIDSSRAINAEDLALEYTVRLIDEVLAAGMKEK